jgi:hypothetical protein
MELLPIVVAMAMLAVFVSVSLAQTPAANVPKSDSPAQPLLPRSVTVSDLAKNGPFDSSEIPWKQIIQLGFVAVIGITSLLIQYAMLSKTASTPSDIIKGGVLILIITLSVSSLIFGFDDKQVAPIVGLFGTIIGFLLGKADSTIGDKNASTSNPPSKDDHAP